MKVNDKVIVVTGAGSGIGRELALQLIKKGARVAGVDVNAASLAQTRELVGVSQDRFFGFEASVADSDAVSELPTKVAARFGAVDGLINNAGIVQPFVRLNDLDYATIDRVIRVNLYGVIFVTKAFLPYLMQRPEAHIVNLSSMGGFVPVPGQTIYCAAKAAVKLMSEGLASELLSTTVKVSVACPGAVATNILQNSGVAGPVMESSNGSASIKPLTAAEAAARIIRGMEANRYHIFVGKDATIMDKLYRLAPQFAGRTIAKKMAALLPA
jgi:NAD(P)-dependent dehydrogenase (short-subunit alcohol dehydrogenase family)